MMRFLFASATTLAGALLLAPASLAQQGGSPDYGQGSGSGSGQRRAEPPERGTSSQDDDEPIPPLQSPSRRRSTGGTSVEGDPGSASGAASRGSETKPPPGSRGSKGSDPSESSGAAEAGSTGQKAQHGKMSKQLKQQVTRFKSYDENGDGKITKGEMRTTLEPVFATWDYDGDEELVDLEIVHGLFMAWDMNGDARLDQKEFQQGRKMWLPAEADIDFAGIDQNRDRQVALGELAAGLDMAKVQLYSTDKSESMSSNDLADAILSAFDADEDGNLTRQEWPVGTSS